MSDVDIDAKTSRKRPRDKQRAPAPQADADSPTDRLVVVPDHVLEKPHPDAQVFSQARRFRPITWGLVAALAVCLGYGIFAIVSAFSSSSASLHTVTTANPVRIPLASTAAASAGAACETVSISTFLDADGNGIRGSAEMAPPPVRIGFRGPDGKEIFAAETNDAGTLTFRLDNPLALSAHPDAGTGQGLWPGARLGAVAASSIVLEGPACQADLPFLWQPTGAQTPRVGWAAGSTPPAGSAAESASALATLGGGVQLAGRVFSDVDADGVFTLVDTPTSGVLVQLFNEDGIEVARVITGSSGMYSFANLEPRAIYEVRIGVEEVAAAHAIGWVANDPSATAFVRTGDIGLAVWGVDFLLSETP